MTTTALPDRKFFKIGEVAEIVGVKPHVLRYWESEFRTLRPMKTRGAHRMYRREDVELSCLIRRLLYDEGFTIPGVKKRIKELQGEREEAEGIDERASRELNLRAELLQVRAELAALLSDLDGATGAKDRMPAAASATVMAVVPKTVLIQRNR